MALHAVNPQPGDDSPEPCGEIKTCPVCEGRMELVYDRHHQKVCVCVDCHSGLTVPASAWEVARYKQRLKRTAKA
jgi:hypothetical protein